MTTLPTSDDSASAGAVHAYVRDGSVRIAGEGSGMARLTWASDVVAVKLFGEPVDDVSCRAPVGARVDVRIAQDPARIEYEVEVSSDRMQALLRVRQHTGVARTLRDAAPAPELRLQIDEHETAPPAPNQADAIAALQREGIVHGVNETAVSDAVAQPGVRVLVARGTAPIEGRDGYVEPLVDVTAMQLCGVMSGTPLARRVRRREGVPGRDVTGRDISVPQTREARIVAEEGASVDEHGIMAVATCDGAPFVEQDGRVGVRHELVVEEIDTATGDIEFNGSVRVTGSVHEGRRLTARDEVHVEGSVERAVVESGASLTIDGAILSSVLRAGGERAVAASIADRVLELPRQLGVVAAQARQFRDQAEARGTEISNGLAIQLVLERIHKGVLPALASIADDLIEAGPAHRAAADRVARWRRELATSANISLTPEQFQSILVEVGVLVQDVRRAVEQPADLHVSYMQASEAEATGVVTITGKGIYNSRIVAWGGIVARHHEAVVRGGSLVSHGAVQVREIGSPSGASTAVHLHDAASLAADRVLSGTVIASRSHTHRFVSDRTSVEIGFDAGGAMDVQSFAA